MVIRFTILNSPHSMLDHPIILLIVIAAALLRWLSQRSRTENQEPERPTISDEPISRGSETQTEEERIRRFLEALGQPAGSRPPPKVAPKRETRPRAFVNPTLPPLTTVPPPLPVSSTISTPPPPPLPIQRVFTPAPAAEASFEVRDLSAPSSSDLAPELSRSTTQQSLSDKLRSPQGLRDAIILREIFGPPRSLQTVDPISGF
jgi:hypothetical protein